MLFNYTFMQLHTKIIDGIKYIYKYKIKKTLQKKSGRKKKSHVLVLQ